MMLGFYGAAWAAANASRDSAMVGKVVFMGSWGLTDCCF
jgi:hypothetical protein